MGNVCNGTPSQSLSSHLRAVAKAAAAEEEAAANKAETEREAAAKAQAEEEATKTKAEAEAAQTRLEEETAIRAQAEGEATKAKAEAKAEAEEAARASREAAVAAAVRRDSDEPVVLLGWAFGNRPIRMAAHRAVRGAQPAHPQSCDAGASGLELHANRGQIWKPGNRSDAEGPPDPDLSLPRSPFAAEGRGAGGTL